MERKRKPIYQIVDLCPVIHTHVHTHVLYRLPRTNSFWHLGVVSATSHVRWFNHFPHQPRAPPPQHSISHTRWPIHSWSSIMSDCRQEFNLSRCVCVCVWRQMERASLFSISSFLLSMLHAEVRVQGWLWRWLFLWVIIVGLVVFPIKASPPHSVRPPLLLQISISNGAHGSNQYGAQPYVYGIYTKQLAPSSRIQEVWYFLSDEFMCHLECYAPSFIIGQIHNCVIYISACLRVSLWWIEAKMGKPGTRRKIHFFIIQARFAFLEL